MCNWAQIGEILPPPGSRTPERAQCNGSPSIGDELALRAGVDPAWDVVLAVYLDGAAMYPHPFVNRARVPMTQV